MKLFDDIKDNWKNQKIGDKPQMNISFVESKLSKLKKQQRLVPIILGLTIVILLCFLFLQAKPNYELLKFGILLMSLSLLIRIIFELWSITMMGSLDVTKEFNLFYERFISFQKTRKLIHFIVTPIVLIIYMLAFYSLLPIFKSNVSNGMYQYIVWSSVIVFSVIMLVKFFSIPKEMKLINELNEELKCVELSNV